MKEIMQTLEPAEATYPLSVNPIFHTIQGEGDLLGLPMVFVRLGGCSVGCAGCDTDYRVRERRTARQIADAVASLTESATRWVWITGGEPADHDLTGLFTALRDRNPDLKIALATSGTREVAVKPDFLSVSPHSLGGWRQRSGHEVKLVFGLDGMPPDAGFEEAASGFASKYVAPFAKRNGVVDAVSLRHCINWVSKRPLWKMTCQAHRQWGVA